MATLSIFQVTSVIAMDIKPCDPEETNFKAKRTIRVQTTSGEELDLELWAMEADQLLVKPAILGSKPGM